MPEQDPREDTEDEIDALPAEAQGLDDPEADASRRRLAGPEWEEEATGVEEAARQRSPPTGLPISRGDLRQRPFGELLAEIHRWRADGALLVSRAKAKKIVYFRAGRPVFVRSNSVSECLGRILMREKLISEADCEESLRRMKLSQRQQGTILIEMGRISPHNLVYALGLQLQTKLFDLFGWQEGGFAFDPDAALPAEPIELELTTAAIIHEGIRRRYTDAAVALALKDVLDRFPVPAHEPLYRFQDLHLDEEEARLLAAADGSKTLSELAACGLLPPLASRRFLLAMRIAQLLEFEETRHATAPPPLPAAPRGQTAPPLPTQTREAPKAGPAPSRVAAELLSARIAELRKKDHFEVLGVGRDAPPAELRAAYLALAKEYHPDKNYSSASAEVRELAAEIYHLVSTAFETLSDAEERQRYLAELAEGGERPEPDAVAKILAAEGKFQLGQELLRGKRHREAAQAFQEAVALYGEEGEFHAYLGWSLFLASPGSEEALAQALDAIEKAIRLNPKVDKSYLFLGYIQKAIGGADKAERQFEKALQCNPDCLEALHELRLIAQPGRT